MQRHQRHQQSRQRAVSFPTQLLRQFAFLALLIAFFSAVRLHAQTGSITGTIVDPSGAAIPGAQVQIVNQATGDLARETTSDASGHSAP